VKKKQIKGFKKRGGKIKVSVSKTSNNGSEVQFKKRWKEEQPPGKTKNEGAEGSGGVAEGT